MEKYAFSYCLDRMLSILNISSSALSKSLNIDPSLVNKWRHGIRIPPYNSHYLRAVSQYIQNSIFNSFQKRKIEEFIAGTGYISGFHNELSFLEKVEAVLSESRGVSVSIKQTAKQESAVKPDNSGTTGNNAIADFLKGCKVHTAKETIPVNYASGCSDNTVPMNPLINPPVKLSGQDLIITGSSEIINTALDLLESAANTKCSTDDPILLTFNKFTDLALVNSGLYFRWNKVLSRVLKNGWKIIILVQLDRDFKKTMDFIDSMQSWLVSGNIYPYYFKRYDNLSECSVILVVPGAGAMLCLQANEKSITDSAFYFKNKAAIYMLSESFNQQLQSAAQPLIKLYTDEKSLSFQKMLVEAEERAGNRYFYKEGLSLLTLPLSLYESYLKRVNLPVSDIISRLDYHERRLQAFYSHIQYFAYKDICTKEPIERMVRNLCYPYDAFYMMGGFKVAPEDIIEHINNIIFMLKKYANYEIALVGENEIDNSIKYHWIVKEKVSAQIHVWRDYQLDSGVNYVIEEPTIVRAFGQHFINIWEQIAPVNREKEEVIKWLEEQIAILQHPNSRKL